MMQLKNIIRHSFLAIAIVAMCLACEEKESDLGIGLQDPSTQYQGQEETFVVKAFTYYEDSLQTSGAPAPYSTSVVGNYSDNVFGKVKAVFFSQIAVPNESGINIDPTIIDSVVLRFVVREWYPNTPDSSGKFRLHFKVSQLAEMLATDSNYYATDDIATNGVDFYNATITCSERDTMISLKLNSSAHSIFSQASTSEDFLEFVKGIRVELLDDSDPCMPTINLAAVNTNLRVNYTYDGDTAHADFLCGTGTNHFSKIIHNYTSANSDIRRLANNHSDSVSGDNYLYLEPLGGTKVKFYLNDFISSFREDHPYAIIHYAELIMKNADIADGNAPTRLLAYKRSSAGFDAPIPDLINEYYGDAGRGFDGYYDAKTQSYRMRITQHLQKLLRTGEDFGTTILIDARRSSARRTIIQGSNGSEPVKIKIIYSEAEY